MASRLYNILNNIEQGRKLCITNAKLANLNANDNMNFNDIANLFLLKNTSETINTWVRPSDWWDTETILSNATTRTDDDNNTVYPAYILLLADWDKTTTFSKSSVSNATLQGDGYLTSDGVWYGTTDATHTWDETQDKACSDGYKTRYVIVYTKSKTTSLGINIKSFPCLEIIIGDCTCTLTAQNNGYLINAKSLQASNYVAIDNYAFQNCYALESIYSSSVTSVGQYGFQACCSLKNVYLPNVTYINSQGFKDCTSLTEITLPKLASSNLAIFTSCWSLVSVSLPKVTTLGNQMFQTCYSLKNVNLPELTSVSQNAFQNCLSLESISLPKVTSLGNTCFQNCAALKTISCPLLTSVGTSAISGCHSLTHVSFPSVTAIYSSAFQNCPSLATINLPSLITVGANNIFNGCFSLTNITIPDTITNLPTTTPAFGAMVKSLTLPANFKISGLNLTQDTGLVHSSLVDILDKLADVTNENATYTLTLGATNLAKISAAELAVGTAKGWTIS